MFNPMDIHKELMDCRFELIEHDNCFEYKHPMHPLAQILFKKDGTDIVYIGHFKNWCPEDTFQKIVMLMEQIKRRNNNEKHTMIRCRQQ